MERYILAVLIFVLFSLSFDSVAFASTDETITITVTVIGGSFKDTPKDPETVSITKEICLEGRMKAITEDNRKEEFGDATFVAAKNSKIVIIPPATEVIIWRLVPHASGIGITAFKSGDTHLPPQTYKDVAMIPELGAGEIAVVTWIMSPEPEAEKPTNKPAPTEGIWVNPLLNKSNKIIFSVTGEGMMDTIEGHVMPVLESSSPIRVTPVASCLNAFDILSTRWSDIDGKQLELYSIQAAVWQNGNDPVDLSKMGSGEYSIIWTDDEGLLLNDPGPFPEFELTGSNVSDTAKTFYAMWQWTNRKHTQGEWVWLE